MAEIPKYKGYEINFEETHGRFSAKAGGKFFHRTSLKAIKNHIDRVEAEAFVPFKAYIKGDWRRRGDANGLLIVNVLGREKAKRPSWRNNDKWLIEGWDSQEKVMELSPENLNAIKALNAHEEETNKIEQERRKQKIALAAKIKWLVPFADK